MNYRLTYAMNEDEIYVVELTTEKSDFHGAYEDSIQHIEEEHGTGSSLTLVALSVVILGDNHAN